MIPSTTKRSCSPSAKQSPVSEPLRVQLKFGSKSVSELARPGSFVRYQHRFGRHQQRWPDLERRVPERLPDELVQTANQPAGAEPSPAPKSKPPGERDNPRGALIFRYGNVPRPSKSHETAENHDVSGGVWGTPLLTMPAVNLQHSGAGGRKLMRCVRSPSFCSPPSASPQQRFLAPRKATRRPGRKASRKRSRPRLSD